LPPALITVFHNLFFPGIGITPTLSDRILVTLCVPELF